MPLKIDGTAVRLRGGREVLLPPLTVRMVRKFTKDGRLGLVTSIGSSAMPNDEQWGALVALVTEALLPNEPGITEEEIEDLLDFSNMHDAIRALFASSGFRKMNPGEAPSPSTGTTSSPT